MQHDFILSSTIMICLLILLEKCAGNCDSDAAATDNTLICTRDTCLGSFDRRQHLIRKDYCTEFDVWLEIHVSWEFDGRCTHSLVIVVVYLALVYAAAMD